jgi:hypothetical protein
MALADEVQTMRQQGLTNPLIMEELTKKGYPPEQINAAIQGGMPMQGAPDQSMQGSMPTSGAPSNQAHDSVYERIESITENLIDEKWDELIAEVKKIIDWKQKIEDRQTLLDSELKKLKEDFKTLHGGVLGKLETYDSTIREVGTELHAVGKVFKDVIPVFVENVKELKGINDDNRKS